MNTRADKYEIYPAHITKKIIKHAWCKMIPDINSNKIYKSRIRERDNHFLSLRVTRPFDLKEYGKLKTMTASDEAMGHRDPLVNHSPSLMHVFTGLNGEMIAELRWIRDKLCHLFMLNSSVLGPVTINRKLYRNMKQWAIDAGNSHELLMERFTIETLNVARSYNDEESGNKSNSLALMKLWTRIIYGNNPKFDYTKTNISLIDSKQKQINQEEYWHLWNIANYSWPTYERALISDGLLDLIDTIPGDYYALSHVWHETCLSFEEIAQISKNLNEQGYNKPVWCDKISFSHRLRLSEVSKMSKIYNNATYVVVVLSSDDVTLLDHLVLKKMIDPVLALEATEWAKRLWTFQEYRVNNNVMVTDCEGQILFRITTDEYDDYYGVNKNNSKALLAPRIPTNYLCMSDAKLLARGRIASQEQDYERALIGLVYDFRIDSVTGKLHYVPKSISCTEVSGRKINKISTKRGTWEELTSRKKTITFSQLCLVGSPIEGLPCWFQTGRVDDTVHNPQKAVEIDDDGFITLTVPARTKLKNRGILEQLSRDIKYKNVEVEGMIELLYLSNNGRQHYFMVVLRNYDGTYHRLFTFILNNLDDVDLTYGEPETYKIGVIKMRTAMLR